MIRGVPCPTFEVCVDSPDGVRAAAEGGAERVELCSDLLEGGLTPSAGCLAVARRVPDVELVAMVRPRGGDFCYSASELEVLALDLAHAVEQGVDGVALGVLTPDAKIDVERTAELVRAARPARVTFHRAFDWIDDQVAALEQLIELGVDRVLTSGGAPTAPEGADRIRALVERAAGRIEVVAGCGVRVGVVRELVERTGVGAVHFTAFTERTEADGPGAVRMGPADDPTVLRFTDAELVRKYRRELSR